jgi:hypothetical protein
MDRTNYQYDLEYRADVRTRIRAVATQLLSGEIGMIAGARELKQFRDGVEPDLGKLLDVFVGLDSETDHLPIGDQRTIWDSEALKQNELEIAATEARWRERALAAARQLSHLPE